MAGGTTWRLEELEGIGSEEQAPEKDARVALESTPSGEQHHQAAASVTTLSRQTARQRGGEEEQEHEGSRKRSWTM